MSLITIEESIEEIKAGRMVILVDDEDRENEGDLTMAAEAVTPEAINFMSKYGRKTITGKRGYRATEGIYGIPVTAEGKAVRG